MDQFQGSQSCCDIFQSKFLLVLGILMENISANQLS